ncbi:MAG: radical SAM/SPASM domain-containing protein [Thermodesulfobacteriota bacterium]
MPGIRLFHVELTNACNFKCEFCPVTVTKRKPCFMPLSLFKEIVDQVGDNWPTSCIMLHVLGEPLLHADVLDAVRHAADRNLKVIVTTNGSLLNGDMIRGLNDSGLYSMDISLELLGRDRHVSRHSGMRFEDYYHRVLESVRTIREKTHIQLIVKVMNTAYRRLFSFDSPPVYVQEGREFKTLVHRLIMDIYRTLGAGVQEREVADRLKNVSLNAAIRIRLQERLHVFVQLFMDWGNAFCERRVYPARFGSCSFAFSAPAVLSDGSVVMCCADYDGHTKLGHANDGPLASILNSERAQYLWEGFEKHRPRHPYCRRCLGGPNRLLAWGKGLGSILVAKFMKLEGENQVIIR